MNTNGRQRFKRWGWLGCILLFGYLASCTQVEVEERAPSPTGGETVEALFKIEVKGEENGSTKAGVDSLQTRAASALTEVEERSVKTLWVGQYVGGVLQNGGMKGAYISAVDIEFIEVRLKSSSEPSTVYLVTNAGNLGTPNEATLKTMIKNYGSTGSSVETGVKSNGLIMVGKWEGVVDLSSSGETLFEKTVGVERLAAKIRFQYSFPVVSGFTFTPKSLTLKSVPNGSRYLEPTGQLSSGITYVDIPASSYTNGEQCWYIPENKAGRGDKEASEKEKTGKPNATYIELIGDAVQNGVAYTGVKFKFYPGSDSSDYNIQRNQFYNIDVEIKGIDFADKRVTVGDIPTPTPPVGNLGAEAGSTKTIQITEQPGKTWDFVKDAWYSITGDGVITNGNRINGKGPVLLTVTSLSSNPQATERSHNFSISGVAITIKQNPATVVRVAPNGSGTVQVQAISDGGMSYLLPIGYRATKGLPVTFSTDADWITNMQNKDESTGEDQVLSIERVSNNTSSSIRQGNITIQVGNQVAPVGPSVVIPIQQAASVLNVSNKDVSAGIASGYVANIINSTNLLSWSAATSTTWLKLTNSSGTISSGSGSVGFNVTATNPDESPRSGSITVKAGNAIYGSDSGLTKTITVKQSAPSLSIPTSTTIGATSTYSSFTFSGTAGLDYSASTTTSWLSIARGYGNGVTSGNSQTIGYNVSSMNTSTNSRIGQITVKVGNITKYVTITQSGSSFSVSPTSLSIPAAGGSASTTVTATSELGWSVKRTSGSTEITASISSSAGNSTVTFSASANGGVSRSAKFSITDAVSRSYDVSVSQYNTITLSNETGRVDNQGDAEKFCNDLTENNYSWRLPTLEEMQMSGLTTGDYWTSTVSRLYAFIFAPELPDGYLQVAFDESHNSHFVRCVRD